MFENKKAHYDYEILEELECGIMLESWEVKSIANKVCSIVGSHCKVLDSDVFLIGASMGSSDNDQQRTRKLLLHRKEINRLIGKTREKGLTLIPLKLYSKKGKFKLSIGVARGKKEYDKRATDKKRDIELETRKIVKSQKLL
jgi:SsrA-binding protein|tara:strand:- start:4472 stop:4897 length:426 start_codon:yes stop_codon:yes gene_type:complete